MNVSIQKLQEIGVNTLSNLDIFKGDSLNNCPKWKYYTHKYVL